MAGRKSSLNIALLSRGHIKSEDIGPNHKVKGVVAELKTLDKKGKRIGSKLVFKPYCNYYVPRWNDEWAETEFTDFEDFVNKFGEDVLKKVNKGRVVPVEHSLGISSIKKTCGRINKFVKHKSNIIYPVKGKQEMLIRKDIYDKMY